MITFREYLSIVNEDAQEEVAKLQSEITTATILAQKAAEPHLRLVKQKQALLNQKQRQAAAEAKKNQQGGQTPTPQAAPGSTPGAGQPGVGGV